MGKQKSALYILKKSPQVAMREKCIAVLIFPLKDLLLRALACCRFTLALFTFFWRAVKAGTSLCRRSFRRSEGWDGKCFNVSNSDTVSSVAENAGARGIAGHKEENCHIYIDARKTSPSGDCYFFHVCLWNWELTTCSPLINPRQSSALWYADRYSHLLFKYYF